MDTETNFDPSADYKTILQEKLRNIVKRNGIANPISEVIVTGTGLAGENFGSTVGYATIKFKDESREPLYLFTKRQVEVDAAFEEMNDWGLFEGEVEFFGKYIPMAERLCKSKRQDGLLEIYPKCYYADDQLIVLENLVLCNGFIMLDKSDQQDFEAAALALENLAKHHAISHAVMIEHKAGSADFFKELPGMKDTYLKSPT